MENTYCRIAGTEFKRFTHYIPRASQAGMPAAPASAAAYATARFVDENLGDLNELVGFVNGMPMCRCVLCHVVDVCGEPRETRVSFAHTCGGGRATATITGPMYGFDVCSRTYRVVECKGHCLEKCEATVSAYMMRKLSAVSAVDVL